MNLTLKGFGQLIQDMGAALQSSTTNIVDVSVGSVVRALFEANASVVLWMQWIALQVLQNTRASTSAGADLDSWMFDFGLSRMPATAATGMATFSRFVATLPASVPVGSTIKTTDGTSSFMVIEDTSVSIWQPGSAAYIIPSGVNSADVPIVCSIGGSTGNVLAGFITIIASSLPGVDQVYNENPLSNGIDAESDSAFRSRFQGYLSSLSRATVGAVANAVANVRQGLDTVILENTSQVGNTDTGAFLVIVDDGTGYPSTDLLSDIANAVEAVRPIGSTFAIIPPQVLVVNVGLDAQFSSASAATLGIPIIQNYVATYLNSLPIGGTASVTRLAQHAYRSSHNIKNIANIQLNGSSTDVVPATGTVIKSGQVTVSINGG